MKGYQYILSTFALIFVVNVGLANTSVQEIKAGSQEQEQEQEERRKSDQTMMRPDDGSESEPTSQEVDEESPVQSLEVKSTVYRSIEKADSVKEESISKYNFIFYFLYKFKYDGEDAP